MPDDSADVSQLAASLSRGSIVAAAGCGKTEQIARAVALCDRRRLVLTHTHAGVDAIVSDSMNGKVPPESYRVDTIAGWCLRYTIAFPKRSESRPPRRRPPPPTGMRSMIRPRASSTAARSTAFSKPLTAAYSLTTPGLHSPTAPRSQAHCRTVEVTMCFR